MLITARNNEKVKRLRHLVSDKKTRDQEGVFIAEGVTILSDMPEDCPVVSFFVKQSCEEIAKSILDRFPVADKYLLADEVFDSVSDTVSPSGIIAVISKKQQKATVNTPSVVLLDGVSDAGNVGTIIRTAAAKGVKTIVCVHSCADPFSPKAVRASMGGIFCCDVITVDAEEALKMLKGYPIIILDMGGKSIFEYEPKEKTVLVVGNEAHGISPLFRAAATESLSIPMAPNGVESLNAAVAAGIAMYLTIKGEQK